MKLIRIRFLIPRIKTNQNPVHFSVRPTICMVICGAYSIRPYADDKNLVHFPVHLAICMTICGAYAVAPYTGTRKNGDYFIPRLKTNQNPDEFSACRVGAYCIRPTDDHARGRMKLIPIRFLIPRIKMNQKSAGFFIPRVKRNPIPTEFSIPRPKTNLNSVGFFNPGLKGMAVPSA